MKNQNENLAIVAFHIGRGGRRNNAGHKTFIGEKKIGTFTDHLFLNPENLADFSKRYGFDIMVDLIQARDFDTLEEKFGITEEMIGEQIYTDCNGNQVGLTLAEEETGIGCIDEDGQYDTTYSCYLSDCSEEEIELISSSDFYKSIELTLQIEALKLI